MPDWGRSAYDLNITGPNISVTGSSIGQAETNLLSRVDQVSLLNILP